jgi:hypothetical protein
MSAGTVTVWNGKRSSHISSQNLNTNPTNNQSSVTTSGVFPLERRYFVPEVASILNLSTDTVRNLFIDEPGVIIITKRRRGIRIYRTLLIPQSVLERKIKSMTVGAL